MPGLLALENCDVWTQAFCRGVLQELLPVGERLKTGRSGYSISTDIVKGAVTFIYPTSRVWCVYCTVPVLRRNLTQPSSDA